MRLLILTQKIDINDDVLGFFHRWVEEFAMHCEKVTVVVLGVGEYKLPDNVKVLSLGKPASRVKYIWNFYKYIWSERKNYDAVFVHMNSEYVVLGGLLWRLWGKKISLWHVHRHINLKLIIAEKLADKIFTASKESVGLKSKKIIITGHGIDTDRFKPDNSIPGKKDKFKIIYVGRISKIKNQDLLIKGIDILVNKNNLKNIEVEFVGAPIMPGDNNYLAFLKKMTDDLNLGDYVKFVGRISNKDIAPYYTLADLSVNLCPTGGVDKAVLESMACAVPAITLNKTFAPIFGMGQKEFILENNDPRELAGKIHNFYSLWRNFAEKPKIDILKTDIRKTIIDSFDLKKTIKRIVSELA